ncbi:MAG: MerR family transcriptional regulator [Christensenellaceae bacterium]|jgi:DNA-binding transcriptional MerR regulator|nr:MerR family transcriptional regulator [Christensenellaceae bacterium]
MGYTIKQVSERSNLTAHVLRYYEKEGLLPPVRRSSSGIRHYTEEDLECLDWICCLKNTGMSIKQIKAFMALHAAGPNTLPQRCDMLRAHKLQVEAQMLELQRHLEKVSHKIEYFTGQYAAYLAGGGSARPAAGDAQLAESPII